MDKLVADVKFTFAQAAAELLYKFFDNENKSFYDSNGRYVSVYTLLEDELSDPCCGFLMLANESKSSYELFLVAAVFGAIAQKSNKNIYSLVDPTYSVYRSGTPIHLDYYNYFCMASSEDEVVDILNKAFDRAKEKYNDLFENNSTVVFPSINRKGNSININGEVF